MLIYYSKLDISHGLANNTIMKRSQRIALSVVMLK